jgi:hypothetical protein
MLVASRLGHGVVLDDATLYFVAGCFAHQNRMAENNKVVRKTYGRGLSSLRSTLMHREDIEQTRIIRFARCTTLSQTDS